MSGSGYRGPSGHGQSNNGNGYRGARPKTTQGQMAPGAWGQGPPPRGPIGAWGQGQPRMQGLGQGQSRGPREAWGQSEPHRDQVGAWGRGERPRNEGEVQVGAWGRGQPKRDSGDSRRPPPPGFQQRQSPPGFDDESQFPALGGGRKKEEPSQVSSGGGRGTWELPKPSGHGDGSSDVARPAMGRGRGKGILSEQVHVRTHGACEIPAGSSNGRGSGSGMETVYARDQPQDSSGIPGRPAIGRGRARGRARGARQEGPVRRPGHTVDGRPIAGLEDNNGKSSAAADNTEAQQAWTGDKDPISKVMGQLDIQKEGDGETEDESPPVRKGVSVEEKRHMAAFKKGNRGQPVQLMSNHFKLEPLGEWHMYHYQLTFKPDIESPKVRSGLLGVHRETLGPFISMGPSLVTLKRLGTPSQTTLTLVSQRRDGTAVEITLKFLSELPSSSPEVRNVLGLLWRKIQNLQGFIQFGRHCYSEEQRIQIPQHRMEVWPGFLSAIFQYDNGPMLTIDVSHKILRPSTVEEDILDNYDRLHGKQAALVKWAEENIVHTIVMTRYNNRTYKIDGIDWNARTTDTFQTLQGQTMTYQQYFQEHHGINLGDPEEPACMLVHEPTEREQRRGLNKPIYLPPQVCFRVGIPEEMRKSQQVMKDLGAHTRINPEGRAERLTAYIQNVNSNQNLTSVMKNWSMRLHDNLLPVEGHVLPPETIQLGRGQTCGTGKKADWSFMFKNAQLYKTVQQKIWLLFHAANQQSHHLAVRLMQALTDVSSRMGVDIGMARLVPVRLNNPKVDAEIYSQAVRQILADGPKPQLVVILIRKQETEVYNAIKRICIQEFPVPSQVVVERTLKNPKVDIFSIATKVAIQVQCKLGAEAWAVPLPDFFNNTMVVGIDVFHSTEKKKRSVAAVICSLNNKFTSYFSRAHVQPYYREEIIHVLGSLITSAVQQYIAVNKTRPKTIVVYRDGVGDGQFEAVKTIELSGMRDALNAIWEDYRPNITFVVVQKRINTRIFTQGRYVNNPAPGTVVDTKITRPGMFDFFLVSQSVNQGTVTPTHYTVLFNGANYKADALQKLTYALTHLYYNWGGTIRVPAPCQYAHKLAFLVGQSLITAPGVNSLADKLYYL